MAAQVVDFPTTDKAKPVCSGVSRDGENPKAMVAYFDRALTDEEMRFFHDCLRRWQSLT